MASLKVLTYPDPVLARKSEPLVEITDEIRNLAQDMLETMYENRGIGLAAPQVGKNVRLITVDLSGPERREEPKVYVNPAIVAKEGETETEEGCLSVIGYRSLVKRAAWVSFTAQDLEGETVELEADDLLAVCLQHELDHLDGVLFIDHISRLKRALYENRLRKWKKKK
ncbi:MAG: peptide deformylase [Deltaproteobacteria bacterium]|nr:peptide deformylase [Deltaproteobacteria bacterium]